MRIFRCGKTLPLFLLLLLLWQWAAQSGLWSTYVLPSPQQVGSSLLKMLQNGSLWKHLSISLLRVLEGFSLSCLLTLLLTLLAALRSQMVPYYSRFLSGLRHIPPLSLIPLFILWFGIGEAPKIILIVLSSIFPILLNTESGIFGCDPKLIEVGKTFGFSRRQIFFRIMLPNAVPDILVGLRLGLGYGWRAIVGAEMIAATSGLGYLILDAQAMSRTDQVIACVLVIAAVGLLCDAVCERAERRVRRRRDRGE